MSASATQGGHKKEPRWLTHWVLVVEVWIKLGEQVRTVVQLLYVSREPSHCPQSQQPHALVMWQHQTTALPFASGTGSMYTKCTKFNKSSAVAEVGDRLATYLVTYLVRSR